jgi:hypothetical protein
LKKTKNQYPGSSRFHRFFFFLARDDNYYEWHHLKPQKLPNLSPLDRTQLTEEEMIETEIVAEINETKESTNIEEEDIDEPLLEIDQDAIAENDNRNMLFDSNPILFRSGVSERKNAEEEEIEEPEPQKKEEEQNQDKSPDSSHQDQIKEEEINYENETNFSTHICVEMLTLFFKKQFKSLRMLIKMNNLLKIYTNQPELMHFVMYIEVLWLLE